MKTMVNVRNVRLRRRIIPIQTSFENRCEFLLRSNCSARGKRIQWAHPIGCSHGLSSKWRTQMFSMRPNGGSKNDPIRILFWNEDPIGVPVKFVLLGFATKESASGVKENDRISTSMSEDGWLRWPLDLVHPLQPRVAKERREVEDCYEPVRVKSCFPVLFDAHNGILGHSKSNTQIQCASQQCFLCKCDSFVGSAFSSEPE